MLIRTRETVDSYEAENGSLPLCGGRIKTSDLIGPWERAQARKEAEERARLAAEGAIDDTA